MDFDQFNRDEVLGSTISPMTSRANAWILRLQLWMSFIFIFKLCVEVNRCSR